MNTAIFNDKASMTSVEIAELVGSQHSDVKRSIERLVAKNIIRKPPMAVSEKINNLGFKVQYEHYLFEGEQGKRDSIIVVAQLCPEFTARLVDRWRELEEQIRKPMSEIEMVAAMALEAVRQQKRITQVEEKVSHVAETVEQIKKGTIREGYAGYRQLKAKTGLSDDNREGLAGITRNGVISGYWLAAVKKAGSNPAHSTSITGSCFA